jgi:serine/threonine protein kinase/Tfp pilus assembly protein PilF
MIGQTISHYKVLEELGEGGMGVVFKAEDTKLKRIVALKFLPLELTRDSEAKERFVQEAQAASALDHPNICTIHEIDKTPDGQMFICMACYEGEILKEKINRGPLEIEDAINIAVQIAAGLAKAHDRRIVHRDIKPANIFVTKDGQVKIVDFGVAKLIGKTQLTKIGTSIGTVPYMSPEQSRGDPVDHRTDIWSLGIVLYEMVTGKPPFKADYEQATIYLIMNEALPSVVSYRSDVPKDLERIIEKTLAKEARKRYESVEDLKKDLESLKETMQSEALGKRDTAQESRPSIAVLPFRDMSPQRDQEYFCEGIAEELINALVKLEGLQVAARTSAFQFKDRDSDIKKIGDQLQVKTVLEGSIRKSGNRLRITAQLINIENGFHIWSEKYDRDLNDIFAIQDDISLVIVDKLKVKLLGEERSALVKRHTVDQEAHNLYLKGLYFWNRRLEGGMKMAMEHFRQAIDKDPGYALAHVGIADTYNITGLFGYSPPRETFPKAKVAATRALEIDDTLGEAHASLAVASAFFDWNWSAAEKEFKRAIELNPNYASAPEWYALYLFSMGRFDEAIMEAERARDLDPLSLIINSVVGLVYFFARRYDESITNFQRTLELDPSFLLASTFIVGSYVANGMYDDAIATIRNVEELAKEDAYVLGHLGRAYGVCGQSQDALRLLNTLNELAGKRYVSPIYQAFVFWGLDKMDETFELLEKAYLERNPYLVFLNANPAFGSLKSNPRYKALMKKIGFEE